MNNTDADPVIQWGKRKLREAEAHLADLRLDDMSLVDRIEKDALPEDGVATSDELYEGLGL